MIRSRIYVLGSTVPEARCPEHTPPQGIHVVDMFHHWSWVKVASARFPTVKLPLFFIMSGYLVGRRHFDTQEGSLSSWPHWGWHFLTFRSLLRRNVNTDHVCVKQLLQIL